MGLMPLISRVIHTYLESSFHIFLTVFEMHRYTITSYGIRLIFHNFQVHFFCSLVERLPAKN